MRPTIHLLSADYNMDNMQLQSFVLHVLIGLCEHGKAVLVAQDGEQRQLYQFLFSGLVEVMQGIVLNVANSLVMGGQPVCAGSLLYVNRQASRDDSHLVTVDDKVRLERTSAIA